MILRNPVRLNRDLLVVNGSGHRVKVDSLTIVLGRMDHAELLALRMGEVVAILDDGPLQKVVGLAESMATNHLLPINTDALKGPSLLVLHEKQIYVGSWVTYHRSTLKFSGAMAAYAHLRDGGYDIHGLREGRKVIRPDGALRRVKLTYPWRDGLEGLEAWDVAIHRLADKGRPPRTTLTGSSCCPRCLSRYVKKDSATNTYLCLECLYGNPQLGSHEASGAVDE